MDLISVPQINADCVRMMLVPTSSTVRRLMASCLGVTVALGSTPLMTFAATGKNVNPTRIGTVAFDRSSESLVIPVDGSAPVVQVKKLAPRQYVADLANSVLLVDAVQGQRLSGANLAGWTLDETADGHTVRLRLTMHEDVKPTIQVTRQSGAVVVRFQGPLAPFAEARLPQVKTAVAPVRKTAPAAFPVVASSVRREPSARPFVVGKAIGFQGEAPVGWASNAPITQRVKSALPVATRTVPRQVAPLRSVPAVAARPVVRTAPVQTAQVAAPSSLARIGVAHVDRSRNLITVPVLAGTLPITDLKVVQLNKRWAYLDIPGTRPAFTGVKFENRDDQLLKRWVMAKRPNRNITRLSIALGGDADVDLKVEDRQILMAVRPKVTMLGAAPVAPTAPVVAAAPVAQPKSPVRQAATRPLPISVAHRTLTTRVSKPQVAVTTQLRRPFFDENRYGLVIPYKGTTPLYRWTATSDKHAVLDIKGDMASVGNLLQQFKSHPVMASWRIERRRSAGIVRVGLTFNRDAELVVAADASRKQLLLIPQPALKGEHDAAAGYGRAAKTVLAAIERDANSQHIFIPFEGEVPTYTIEQVSPTFAYLNFEKSSLKNSGVHFFSPDFHPNLNYWLFSERNQGPTVRLALALTQPGRPSVYEDKSQHRLVVVIGDQAQHATAIGRTMPKQPGPWVGPARPAAYKPAPTTIEVSKAS